MIIKIINYKGFIYLLTNLDRTKWQCLSYPLYYSSNMKLKKKINVWLFSTPLTPFLKPMLSYDFPFTNPNKLVWCSLLHPDTPWCVLLCSHILAPHWHYSMHDNLPLNSNGDQMVIKLINTHWMTDHHTLKNDWSTQPEWLIITHTQNGYFLLMNVAWSCDMQVNQFFLKLNEFVLIPYVILT